MAHTVPTVTRFTGMKLRSGDENSGSPSPNSSATSTTSTVDDCEHEVLDRAVPFIENRLYFATRRRKPASTPTAHFFCVDDVYVYASYNEDFGPLHLGMLTKYCRKINRKLKLPTLTQKKIVHVTGMDQRKRVNAAYLMAAYGVLYLNMSPAEACQLVSSESQIAADLLRGGRKNAAINRDRNDTLSLLLRPLPTFRDASIARSTYDLHLIDVLEGLKRAVDAGFYDPETFDAAEYELREQVEQGDSNWILPGKLMGFCGPHPRARVDPTGFPYHSPESYFDYFRSCAVKAVVRLNVPTYEGRRFSEAGFSHYDLYFPDGTTPSMAIVDKFLSVCEKTSGAVAVHCKAGLGRTGTLIACYLMKHYRFSAPQAIGWIRICRPGSVIGTQQNWLLNVETEMWRRGDALLAAATTRAKTLVGAAKTRKSSNLNAAEGGTAEEKTSKTVVPKSRRATTTRGSNSGCGNGNRPSSPISSAPPSPGLVPDDVTNNNYRDKVNAAAASAAAAPEREGPPASARDDEVQDAREADESPSILILEGKAAALALEDDDLKKTTVSVAETGSERVISAEESMDVDGSTPAFAEDNKRRNCWILAEVEKSGRSSTPPSPSSQPSIGDEPDERSSALSQGDFLNRRKMTMKQNASPTSASSVPGKAKAAANVLVQTVVRRSSSASTSTKVKKPPSPKISRTPPPKRPPTRHGILNGDDDRVVSTNLNALGEETRSARVPFGAKTSSRSGVISSPSKSETTPPKMCPTGKCQSAVGAGYVTSGSRGYLTRASGVGLNGNAGVVEADGKSLLSSKKTAATRRSKEN